MDVPGDAIVIECNEMTADESAMTGESDPIKKDT
jgi:magnesium-transporting ATPase (P-type)